MKIIGLMGKTNSGKTSSLKYAMIELLKQNNVEILYVSCGHYQSSKELIEHIEKTWKTAKGNIANLTIGVKYKNKIIGITSFGDSLKYEIIPALNRVIEKRGECDVFVCGRHESNDLKTEFADYAPVNIERIPKQRSINKSLYDADNKKAGNAIVKLI